MNTETTLDIGRGETLLLPNRDTLIGGLKITAKFSSPKIHPYDAITWEKRNVVIFDYAKNKPSFSRDNVEVPTHWAENAVRITASKYLFGSTPETPEYEDSLRHPFDRIANTYTIWGWKNGYFATLEDAKTFNWEVKAMLVGQIWAPNSPVWFNLGHWEQYRWGRPDLREKMAGKGNKAFKAFKAGDGLEIKELDNVYIRPQASACFLTEIEDSMESILHHQITEGRISASGSGAGMNLSNMRSSYEPIAGRGRSSGPISFDKGWDRMAGAIKSGGRCLAPWQLVYTDKGPKAVSELAKMKDGFTCLSFDPTLNKIVAKHGVAWQEGIKPVVDIQTESGSYALSSDHPTRSAAHTITQAGKLAPGDLLHTAYIFDHKTIYGTEDLEPQKLQSLFSKPIKSTSWNRNQRKCYSRLVDRTEKKSAIRMALFQKLDQIVSRCFAYKTFEDFFKSKKKIAKRPLDEKAILTKIKTAFGRFDTMLDAWCMNEQVNSVKEVGNLMTYSIEVTCPSPDDKTSASGHNYLIWNNGNLPNKGTGIFVLNSRRAARMCLLNSDHPDIFDWVNLKNSQEEIAKVILREHNTHVELKKLAEEKLKSENPAEQVAASFILALPLVTEKKYAGDMDGEIYGETVSNQNANHSVSLKGDFWKAYYANGDYSTRWVTKPDKIHATFRAKELLEAMAKSVWHNAEPGSHNSDFINLWNPVKSIGRITTSNPCCFTGETMVGTVDGPYSFKYLAENNNDVYVYCTDPETGRTHIRKMWGIEVKRKNVPITKVTFEDGSWVRCTHDERFLDLDGNYIEAQDCKPGQTLRPFLLQCPKDGPTIGTSIIPNHPEGEQHRAIVSVNPDGNEDVYDGTVDEFHNFAVITAGHCEAPGCLHMGFFAHNSEYFHLTGTSCNLSSLNAFRFLEGDGINTDKLGQAAFLAMLCADLNIEECGFPIPEIAEGTYLYRTTGVGYGNLGGLLMALGIPYDSNEGRYIASLLMSFLTAACWKASATMGKEFGPYLKYEETKHDLHEVLRLHQACHKLLVDMPKLSGDKENTEATISALCNTFKPLPTEDTLTGADALRGLAASFENKGEWDPAWMKVAEGLAKSDPWKGLGNEELPLRNSFVSLEAPGGTVSAPLGIYDQGTTSAEPDYSLVKYKVLSGGGSMTMFNSLALQGLRTLGYSEFQIKEAALEVAGLNGLIIACNGDISDATTHIEKQVAEELSGPVRNLFENTPLPAGSSIGEIIAALAYGKPTDLPYLVTNGKGHVETIPWLQEHHKAVFDCASTAQDGTRSIAPAGHIRMLGALQPFVSGATSKCVTGETILTTSNGLKRIGKLYSGERPDSFTKIDFEVPSPKGTTKATQFYYGGKRPVYKVQLEDGRIIKGTSVHRLRTTEESGLGWKTLPELETGDWVALQLGADMWGEPSVPITRLDSDNFRSPKIEDANNVALFLGMLAAHGHVLKQDYSIHFTKNCDGARNEFSRLLKTLFGLEGSDRTEPKTALQLVSVVSKPLFNWLECANFSKTNIPDFILGGSREMAVAWLGGFLLNGWIDTEQKNIEIGQKYHSITMDTQCLLDNLGVNTYFTDNMLGGVNYLALNIRRQNQEKSADLLSWLEPHLTKEPMEGEFPMHRLELQSLLEKQKAPEDPRTKDILLKTFLNIQGWPTHGANETEKIKRTTFLKAAASADLQIPDEELAYQYTRVAKVDFVGEEEVYDISVPETEQFVANGIVNHNTVNLPDTATEEDILHCFEDSHKMGVKCIALYRNGSKGVSVFSGDTPDSHKWKVDNIWNQTVLSINKKMDDIVAKASIPKRHKLPGRRWAQTVKFSIAGSSPMEGFLIVGIYPDGHCGEVFGRLGQGGSFSHGMFESFCKSFSGMLQWGVPLDKAIHMFKNTAFDPAGFSQVLDPDSPDGRADIRSCRSIVDLMMKILEWMFPDERGNKIRSIESNQMAVDNASLSFESHDDEMEVKPKKINFGAAEECPSCHALAMIPDGKCRRCIACGHSGGGCG